MQDTAAPASPEVITEQLALPNAATCTFTEALCVTFTVDFVVTASVPVITSVTCLGPC